MHPAFQRTFCLIPLAALVLCGSCSKNLQEREFEKLDQVIASRDFYEASFRRIQDSLYAVKASACTDSARWEASYALYRHFRHYQADSALVYLDSMMRFQGDDPGREFILNSQSAYVYASLRDYARARGCIARIDTSLLDSCQKAVYFNADLYIDGVSAVDEFIPQSIRQKIAAGRIQKRLEYIACPGIGSFEKTRRTAMNLYETGHADEAATMLEELFEATSDPADLIDCGYSLAHAHKYTGNRAAREYYLAKDAAISIENSYKDQMALYELSNMLFEDGDLERASGYCQCALKEALSCNYKTRILNSANSQITIVKAVRQKTDRDSVRALLVIIALSVLSAATIALLAYVVMQSRKISRMNALLEEAGRIKEDYMFRYILLSANYLDKMEQYRHDMRVTLKEKGIDGVKQMLRNPSGNTLDHKSFYAIFDETFLGIYPDFPDKVNALLPEENRFEIKKNGEMPTGLRILALIRLGMTDSGKIAEFLGCAPSSVYTYRSKIKKSANLKSADFEAVITSL